MKNLKDIYANAYDLLDYCIRNNIIDGKPPINIRAISNYLNISIKEDDNLQSNQIGKIQKINDHFVISLNPVKNWYETRERFTIAHELAHRILHMDDINTKTEYIDTNNEMSRTLSFSNPIESEANSYAANLLMPDYMIDDIGPKLIEDLKKEISQNTIPVILFIERMADIFNVSKIAMAYRLKHLKIIQEIPQTLYN